MSAPHDYKVLLTDITCSRSRPIDPRFNDPQAPRRSRMADEAEAVLIDAARGQEVQFVDHVVVTTDKPSVYPRRLQDRQFEGSFEELPTSTVVNEDVIASREAHRKRAARNVVGTQIPVELHVEGAHRLVLVLVARSSADRV